MIYGRSCPPSKEIREYSVTEKLADQYLCELTRGNRSTVIAECISGLGCTLYAKGRELIEPWAANKVENMVGAFVRNGVLITNQTQVGYFVLNRDEERDEFEVLRGPLSSNELRAFLGNAKDATK